MACFMACRKKLNSKNVNRLRNERRMHTTTAKCKTDSVVRAAWDKMVQKENQAYADFKKTVAMARFITL